MAPLCALLVKALRSLENLAPGSCLLAPLYKVSCLPLADTLRVFFSPNKQFFVSSGWQIGAGERQPIKGSLTDFEQVGEEGSGQAGVGE